MKLCVLFPGMGYHADKPLLYYSAKLALSRGYDVIPLKFSGFPSGAKNDELLLRQSVDIAFEQCERQLADTDLSRYDIVIFAGKSIGTAVMLKYREKYGINAKALLYTPIVPTFDYTLSDCTAFSGTADQLAEPSEIMELCRRNNVPLYTYDGGNHSIETADIFRNIENLSDIMKKVSLIII